MKKTDEVVAFLSQIIQKATDQQADEEERLSYRLRGVVVLLMVNITEIESPEAKIAEDLVGLRTLLAEARETADYLIGTGVFTELQNVLYWGDERWANLIISETSTDQWRDLAHWWENFGG